jgi:hypothetical protein
MIARNRWFPNFARFAALREILRVIVADLTSGPAAGETAGSHADP